MIEGRRWTRRSTWRGGRGGRGGGGGDGIYYEESLPVWAIVLISIGCLGLGVFVYCCL